MLVLVLGCLVLVLEGQVLVNITGADLRAAECRLKTSIFLEYFTDVVGLI